MPCVWNGPRQKKKMRVAIVLCKIGHMCTLKWLWQSVMLCQLERQELHLSSRDTICSNCWPNGQSTPQSTPGRRNKKKISKLFHKPVCYEGGGRQKEIKSTSPSSHLKQRNIPHFAGTHSLQLPVLTTLCWILLSCDSEPFSSTCYQTWYGSLHSRQGSGQSSIHYLVTADR